MAVSEDLINFDLIETHKENIQSLPGGRSARQLVSILSPMPSGKTSSPPTLDETKTLNDAIRQEYELELQSIAESDDPLDIYDRYVKWTLNAYPSAQATAQSKLLPLLERATKAFLSSAHYKNDPRYLKLWLHYIRFFSDSPRETFAFLARHHIGEGLGLFYEEFAAWLEGAERWTQAEEVYKLGIEREARPAERLLRKYTQFQKRFESRPQNADGPSSPALPTMRPALAAKIDPLSVSHCSLCGARMSPNRCSTHCTIMSLIISPEIPAVVATQLMTSRSWLSRAKATRTISPFQQVNSSASEHQRSFERLVMMVPSCARGTRRPVCRANRSACFFISR